LQFDLNQLCRYLVKQCIAMNSKTNNRCPYLLQSGPGMYFCV